MPDIVILVPIYKTELDVLERYSLDHSLAKLHVRNILFVGPDGLDRRYYSEHYATIPFVGFDDISFSSIPEYNRLLLSEAFYAHFVEYRFVLILQTDAIVLRDELDYWCAQPFDYIGAPWPDGYELFVNAGPFEGGNGKRVRATVGNGGLSLRRVNKCISLLREFRIIVDLFLQTGSSEDLFFSVMGTLSQDFIIPNEITAARFSVELKPRLYYAVNGNKLPMGGHAWWTHDPDFWLAELPDAPLLSSG